MSDHRRQAGSNYRTIRPQEGPPSRAKALDRLARFVEERIAIVGGVTEEGLLRAGFGTSEVAELAADVRKRLNRRGLAFA